MKSSSRLAVGVNVRPRNTVGNPPTVFFDTNEDLVLTEPDIAAIAKTIFPTVEDLTLSEPSPTITTSLVSDPYLGIATYSGTKEMVYAIPANYDPTKSYPLGMFWHGDGAKGTIKSETKAAGTGDGVTTTFTGNFANGASEYPISGSVKVKVNGVQVATADYDLNFVGAGVSGSASYGQSGSSYTLHITPAPPAGQAVTIEIRYSVLIKEGSSFYVCGGDRIPDAIMVFPQIPTSQSEFTVTDFDNVLSYMTSHFNINTNRVITLGLSRGAFQCRNLMQNRTTQICAAVIVSGNYGTGWDWSTMGRVASWWHHGTSDGTVSNGLQGMLTASNAFTQLYHARATNYWGADHTPFVWNTNVFNRKERTDATGTALWDYVRWMKQFSLDDSEQATLFVEAVEYSHLIEDYRYAVTMVNNMPSGSAKTALQGRLTTVKAIIGHSYIIDLGLTANASPGNVNNLSSGNAGTTISNLVSDEGVTSSFGFAVVVAGASSSKQQAISTSRGKGNYYGFNALTNTDGFRLAVGVTNAELKLTGLNNAKTYNIRVYHNYSGGNYTNQSQISCTIGGVTKSFYSELNNAYYLEWDNVSPTSNEIHIFPLASVDRDVIVTTIEFFEN